MSQGMSDLHSMWLLVHPKGFPVAVAPEPGDKPHIILFTNFVAAKTGGQTLGTGGTPISCREKRGNDMFFRASKHDNDFVVSMDGKTFHKIAKFAPLPKESKDA